MCNWGKCAAFNLTSTNGNQHAKKVVSDSPELVDFAIRQVNSVFNLPDGAHDVFLRNLDNRRTVKSNAKYFSILISSSPLVL